MLTRMVRGESNLALLMGISGVGGAFLMAVCDLLLFAYSASGVGFLQMEMGRGTMAFLPQWRLATGSIMGVLVAPLQIVGFWQVFLGLRPTGRCSAWAAFLLLSYAMAVAGAVHGTFVFVGTLLKSYHIAPLAEQPGLRVVLDQFYGYQTWLYLVAGLSLFVGSVVWAISVRSGKSRYPRWAWWLNPFVLVAAITLLGVAAPAPIGGYLVPVQFNAGTLGFFICSTLLLRIGRHSALSEPVMV